jgi:hypothetical protein
MVSGLGGRSIGISSRSARAVRRHPEQRCGPAMRAVESVLAAGVLYRPRAGPRARRGPGRRPRHGAGGRAFMRRHRAGGPARHRRARQAPGPGYDGRGCVSSGLRLMGWAGLISVTPAVEGDRAGTRNLLDPQHDEYDRSDGDGVHGHEQRGPQPQGERSLTQPRRAVLSDEMADLREVGVPGQQRAAQSDHLGEGHGLFSATPAAGEKAMVTH